MSVKLIKGWEASHPFYCCTWKSVFFKVAPRKKMTGLIWTVLWSRSHASSFYKGGRGVSDTDFLFSCWRNFFQHSSRFSLVPLFKELWKKYTVARHSLSSHLWASSKPQSRVNGFVKKLAWLRLGHKKKIIKKKMVMLSGELCITEEKTVLGTAKRSFSLLLFSTSLHDGACKQTCSSSSGFRHHAADWREKKSHASYCKCIWLNY